MRKLAHMGFHLISKVNIVLCLFPFLTGCTWFPDPLSLLDSRPGHFQALPSCRLMPHGRAFINAPTASIGPRVFKPRRSHICNQSQLLRLSMQIWVGQSNILNSRDFRLLQSWLAQRSVKGARTTWKEILLLV